MYDRVYGNHAKNYEFSYIRANKAAFEMTRPKFEPPDD